MICFCMMCHQLNGQIVLTNKERFVLPVTKVSGEIIIDGIIDEESWQGAEATSPFINKWPLDSGFAVSATVVKALFNDQYLYISAKAFQKKEDLIIQTLKRDQLNQFWNSDGFSIVLDPINQKMNGFLFGVNPSGAQIEAAINAQGNWTRINENWDNKWYSATHIYDDYWTVELAIPFSSIRFKEGASEWGLNFIRNDMKNNVYSTWAKVPLQFNGFDLANAGTLRWAERITPEKSKMTLIPFMSASNSKNFEESSPSLQKLNVGLDAKIAVTSSLNLDVTLRPDFSNVEVDRQMTNVTRFSLLFPERRNFFLENADLFTNFGSWQVMPFFSRKIGLRNGSPVPISAGVRLSGNATKGLRVGVMDIQTEATDEQSANNYFVTSAQHQLWARSSVKFFAANRQTTKATEGDTEHDYNRTMGGEFQYVAPSGRTSFTLRAHTAQTPEKLNDNHYFSVQIGQSTKRYYGGVLLERVGQNYVNDFGFVPRLYNYDAARDTTVRIGHYVLNPWMGYLYYPKNSKVNLIEGNSWSVINFRGNGNFLERNTSLNATVSMKNTSAFFIEAFNTSVNLPFSIDIISSGNALPADHYAFTHYRTKYTTDTRKPISAEFSFGGGRFYNGQRLEYGATVNARKQPWGIIGITYLQNKINLGKEYGEANFVLIGPRTEISLRSNLWWTTFLQYNTQAENFNINSRVQWRFKPMSDLFVVYSDNYTSTNFNVKNRGLVVKFTYWLNL